MKKMMSIMLALLMVFTAIPATGIIAGAETIEEAFGQLETIFDSGKTENVTMEKQASLITSTNNEITRAEWLHNLVEVFDMYVYEESYPDNYFSDLDSSHTYYEDILMAVEFGVVDIDAGEELCPDDIATREFAVSTLNFCLGYQMDEDEEYTFADSALCTYPDSAQIAVNRNWVELVDGNFSPEATVTDAEVEAMLNDAIAVLEQAVQDPNHEDIIEFAEDVIEIPADTQVTENDETKVVSIADCPVTIDVGDKFAVYYNEIPVVYTAEAVSQTGNITNITTAEVEAEDAFEEIDIQGTTDASIMEFTPAEGVELTIEDDTSGISTFDVAKINKKIGAKKTITLGNGVKATIDAQLKNPYIEYDVSSNYAYVQLVGDAEITFSASVNLTDIAGISTITLFDASVPGVGGFTVTLNMELSGKASGTVTGKLVAGVECAKGSDIRSIKSFTQTQYYTTAEATAEIALNATLGVTKLPIVHAYVYATVGMIANVRSTTYSSGTPVNCTHFYAYLYANYGVSAGFEFFGWGKSINEQYDIYTSSNSPVKIKHHYEDGVEVAKCTRGVDTSSYFTKYNSRWGGCGWSGAGGSYGLDAAGTPVVLYTYTLDDNNNATITKYNGNSWTVNIPSQIDGYTVTAIGNNAFRYKDVAYVTIPSTVTSIGHGAFQYCYNLRNITIPNSVTTIGNYAFYECTSLSSIDLPDNLENISAKTFYNCSSLANVEIPNSVTEIGNWAFDKCYSLKEVTLSKSLVKLGYSAFAETAIESIEIPKSLDNCGWNGWHNYELDGTEYDSVLISGPFYLCENLKTVTFEKGTTQIAEGLFGGAVGLETIVIPDTVTTIERYAFAGCVRLTDVTIGNAVTTIDDCAFRRCLSLPEVEIPDSVTEIGNWTFDKCYSLKEVTLSKSLVKLGYSAFAETAIGSIEIPKSLDDCDWNGGHNYELDGTEYDSVLISGPFYLCENLKTVTFEKGTTQIAEGLFGGAVGLETIVIPDTVTTIERYAFAGCVRLTDVTIGNAVTTIDDCAFRRCLSLPEVEIPDSVTEIGNWTFDKCYSLKEVTLSKSLVKLGYSAFAETAIGSIEIPKSLDDCDWNGGHNYELDGTEYDSVLISGPFYLCENLKTVTFEKGTTQIAEGLFGGAVGLEKIIIPDTVTTFERYAFAGCVRLTDVTIGEAVATIDDYAFARCLSLPEIVIPDSVTKIGSHAFAKCISLKFIEIPDSVNTIEYSSTFTGCSSLETVRLSKNITNIAYEMFKNCISLKTIEIPANVETIYSSAFENCTSLESFTFAENPKLQKIYQNAFKGCSSLKEAILPEKTKEIGACAFQNCVALEKAYIPQSIRTIGSQAFMGCEALSDVTIADYSITEIEADTFKDCPGLVSIVLPKGLTTIGSQAFMNDTGLTSVTIPESVTSIDSTAFSYPKKTTIYGKAGSYAETFANEYGFTFVDISIPAQGIILKDGSEIVNLDRGETYRAEFEFYPENANDVVTLTADNTKVKIEGMDIYAQSTGDTIITATTSSGMTYEFTVHIRDAKSITITSNPDKMTYALGEEFDNTGMIVTVNYSDNTTEIVTDYVVSGFDSTAEGNCTVTVQWTSPAGTTYKKTLTVEIIDTSPKVTDIYVATLPDKIEYALRESLDTTGLVVKANYTDGSTSEITEYTVSGFNALKTGEQTITITCGEFTTTFTVYVGVSAKTLESIVISTSPSKTTYYIGDSLDTTGLALTLTYSDGSTATVTSGFTTSGFSSSVVGTKTITVTYGGKTTTFTVIVKRPTISLSYTSYALAIGDSLTLNATTTPSGQTITWTSSDSDIAIVENGTVTAVSSGTSTIVAKFVYNGTTYSNTCAITVNENTGCIHANVTYVPAVPSTCTVQGNASYTVCDDCGVVVSGSSAKLPLTGHEYEAVVTAPTCTNQGYTTYTCECGDSYIADYTELSHTPKSITIPASCTVAGMTYTVCEICGETIGDSTVIPAIGHTAGEWEIVLEATYEADGKQIKKCIVCGEVLAEEVIPMLVKITVTDEDTDVSIEVNGDDYAGVVDIIVEESFDGTAFDVIDTTLDASQKFIYDITMTVDGEVVQPTGTVTVRIPLPEGYDPNRSFVYHVDTETGTVEKMSATYEDGYLVFETTHFSYYAVVEEANYSFSIQTPSTTTISKKNGIILHANIEGSAPEGSYVVWTASNNKFTTSTVDDNSLKIISNKNGYTTFTATLYDADGNVLATDSIEMRSKAGFFDVIASWFRKATVYKS